MLRTLNGIRLVRFEPQAHTPFIYQWYYSTEGEYREFFRDWPRCPTLEQIAIFAQQRETFMILNPEGVIVGLFMAQIYETPRNFDCSFLVDKNFERQKIIFTAGKIALFWLFNSINLYKCKIKILARNSHICDSVERFGMFREGGPNAVLKNEGWLDGEYQNIAVYAMFKSDFNKRYKEEFTSPRLEAAATFPQNEPRLETPFHLVENGPRISGTVAPLPRA